MFVSTIGTWIYPVAIVPVAWTTTLRYCYCYCYDPVGAVVVAAVAVASVVVVTSTRKRPEPMLRDDRTSKGCYYYYGGAVGLPPQRSWTTTLLQLLVVLSRPISSWRRIVAVFDWPRWVVSFVANVMVVVVVRCHRR